MTAQISVAQSLGKSRKQSVPRPGTKLRAAYDALRRGERVTDHSLIETLRTFYGMEVIAGRLHGEWEGPYFIPAEKIWSEHQSSLQT